ncbi:ESX secretion-associated protein EspG [Nocardia sp. NPDC006630]|uniref:ESX secretion-associated protein EspG n=1 Tax=Nocardia sp. NPDC006630 TaxID=3157181 RepID=UPI0033B8F017
MNREPIAVELTVDAALLLKNLAEIDSYPSVLALVPNSYGIEDDPANTVVAAELTARGIVNDGRVDPVVVHWLHCLYRPDTELAVRVVGTGLDGERHGMLRFSLVRSADSHVLAVRCDDHIVIQAVYQAERRLDALSAALSAALGPAQALAFEPVTVALDQLALVPAEPGRRRRALLELGAAPHTAGVLTRVLGEVVRRAEVLIFEHHDGADAVPELCMSVLDTLSGRIVVTPTVAADGQVLSTYAPGDDASLQAGIRALVDLLPGRSWFETSRV